MERSIEDLEKRFMFRFAPKVRTKKLDAMQNLLDGKIKMDSQKGVAEYAARFQSEVSRAKMSDTPMILILFRRGLTQNLLAPCRVNYEGDEFESLDALVKHAVGEEKRWKESHPSRASLNFVSSDRNRHAKRPQNHDAFQPVHKKQKRAANGAAAAGAGPSGSSAPNPTAPTRIFSNHLNRVLSYCEWDYYKKNALCVRCGEKGHRGEDCKKFPSAKANVVERMEVDQ
ncbi:hypothetical protein PLESTM_001703200 [Pleodorina starrii]|nr:hypothetical protein PLESTM_001703200 [Pleodorina starrii]